jgi:hypothetical protein
MRAQTARWLAGCIAAESAALIVAGLVLAYMDRHSLPAGQNSWNFPDVFGQVVNLAVPAVGFVLTSRRPANRIGWVFLVAGLALGLTAFSLQYALRALVAAPGSLPAGRAFAWLSNWTWVIPFAMLAFLFLLFPTGRLHSRRWRPAAWFVGAVFAATVVDMIVRATSIWQDPFGSFTEAENPFELTVLAFLIVATLVISVAAVVVRYARSSGDERLQLKWFAAAALLVVATTIPAFLTTVAALLVLQDLAFLCLWLAIGIAVLKYRLYGIDVVISKAVLYGSLAVFITAVYAGLVVGVGALAGNRRSALLAAVAAAVVAVAFQPARQRAGRLANRVVYGRRATPYQVLSQFAQRIGGAYAHEDVLPQMAHIVADGTGAEHVVVWLRVDDELRPEASSDGSPHAGPMPIDGGELPDLPGSDMSVPVVYQGDVLGAISIRMPKGEPLPSGAATRRGCRVAGGPGLVERRADRGPPGVAAAHRHRAG